MKILSTLPEVAPYPAGIERSLIAYGQHLSTDPMTWEEEVIGPWLDANVPIDYSGHLALDWETGAFFDLIQYNPPHSNLNALINEYVGLLLFIKNARPRVSVGYYGLPIGGNTSNKELIWEHWERLAPIFDTADVLFPGWYYSAIHTPQVYSQGVDAWLPHQIKMARDQPIFPYTRHRYSPAADNALNYRLIPPDIHEASIAMLEAAEWEGKKISGIVTWGEDEADYAAATMKNPDGSWTNTSAHWDTVRAVYLDELSIRAHLTGVFDELYVRLVNG